MLKKYIIFEKLDLTDERLLIKKFKPSFIVILMPLILLLISYLTPYSKKFHFIFCIIYFFMTVYYIYAGKLSFITKNELKININFCYFFCFLPNFKNIEIDSLIIQKVKIFFIKFYIITYKNKKNKKISIFIANAS
jgi:hypothetical protein